MTTLHTFGCSITQGHALPDLIRPIMDPTTGQPLTPQQIHDQGIKIDWNHIHVNQPSGHAWPQVLAQKLDVPVVNHARRGACFNQIARQCAVAAHQIKPQDTVIVMWTYISRISLQWPARTAVPLCNIVDPGWGWSTVILGFNKLFGLSPSDNTTAAADQMIQRYIQTATETTYLDPLGVYNQYHNNLVLQVMTAGFLANTGARVIHLSVEPQLYLDQLESARSQLHTSLKSHYVIPDPQHWYTLQVDHTSCRIIHDPHIPPAGNDQHPSVEHHARFAEHVYATYFTSSAAAHPKNCEEKPV